ncbi:MAG: DNA polymerase III subunit delta, partial [Chitinophagaceae bacterium]
MSVEKIISDWKKKIFKPVYWLEGEEEYFIDKAVDYAEHHILNESEASFNLSVFYGKDANWADVLNACRRYPMFAERQVVLLKEAQQMKDVEKLEPYIETPLSSTVFVVSYKEKKLDARKKFAKLVKENGVLVTTKKMYDKDVPAWTQELVHSKGLTISPRGLALLVDHIGNDLTRIENEIDKLSVNLGKGTNITEDDIEKYIGVSKDYNVFELQAALAAKDLARTIRIIQYFEANPKAGPIQLILPSLYSFFSKVFMIFGAGTNDEKTIASSIGVNPYFMKDYMQAARLYSYPGV